MNLTSDSIEIFDKAMKKLFNETAEIITHSRQYYEQLEPILSAAHTIDKRHITELFKIIDSQLKYAAIQDIPQTLSDELDQFATFLNIIKNVDQLFATLNMEHIKSENIDDSYYSQTYKMDMADEFTAVLMEWHTIKKSLISRVAVFENEMVRRWFNYVVGSDGRIDWTTDTYTAHVARLDSFITAYNQAAVLVDVWVNLAQQLIDRYFTQGPDGKRIVHYIMDRVEQQKNTALKSIHTTQLSKKDAQLIKNNPPLTRAGILPQSLCMTVAELCVYYNCSPCKTIKQFISVMLKKNIGIIEIHNQLPGNIEMTIANLVDRSSQIPTTNGVSQEYIKRTKISVPLDSTVYDFTIVHHGPTYESCTVIETLDGKHWRSCSPWPLTGAKTFPTSRAAHFLAMNDMTHGNDSHFISRAEAYQIHAQQAAFASCFLRRPLTLDIIERSSKEVPLQVTKNMIYITIHNEVMGNIKGIIDSAAHDVQHVKRLIITELIAEPVILAITNALLVAGDTAAPYRAAEFNAGKFPASELLSTYIVQLMVVHKQYVKQVERHVNEMNIAPNMDAIKFKTAVEECMVEIVDSILDERDNIFTTANYKYMIMNFQ